MNRRHFLALSGTSSLSLLLSGQHARSSETSWPGPYFVHLHAGGAWDPTLFCDAKPTTNPTVFENRLVTEIDTVNGVPVPVQGPSGAFLLRETDVSGKRTVIEEPKHFFQTVGKGYLVLNGVDAQTNNHENGIQAGQGGHPDIALPALAALYAGKVAQNLNLPLAFFGGDGAYNVTGDVVALSRFNASIDSVVERVSRPFQVAENSLADVMPPATIAQILKMRGERAESILQQATLPRSKRALKSYQEALRSGEAISRLAAIRKAPGPDVEAMAGQLPAAAVDNLLLKDPNGTTRFAAIGQPIERILQCFKAGISVSATFSQGGFDTHTEHDLGHEGSMAVFVSRLRYLSLRAEQLGLTDKLFVIVSSDFGRTPTYNAEKGKDHWNVTSMMAKGPGIVGGRVIGATDGASRAMRVAPVNVKQTLPSTDENGASIHPFHVHREMRRLLGIEKSSVATKFPLNQPNQDLPVLG